MIKWTGPFPFTGSNQNWTVGRPENEASVCPGSQATDLLPSSQHRLSSHIPWDSSCLHGVGQVDIIGPQIKLPLMKTNQSTQHRAGVDTYTHGQVIPCLLLDIPVLQYQWKTKNVSHYHALTTNVTDMVQCNLLATSRVWQTDLLYYTTGMKRQIHKYIMRLVTWRLITWPIEEPVAMAMVTEVLSVHLAQSMRVLIPFRSAKSLPASCDTTTKLATCDLWNQQSPTKRITLSGKVDTGLASSRC